MRKSEFLKERREFILRLWEAVPRKDADTAIEGALRVAVNHAEAAGVEWDPEEPERPRRVRLDEVDGTHLVAEFDASGKGDFWAHLDFEGDWNISLEARRAIAEEVLAAYNREREEEAFDAEHGAEFSAAVEEVCKGEVDALVAQKVREERDRCERLLFLLKLHYSADDAIDGASVRGLIEQFRLAIEQGTTYEQDLPPIPPDYKARSEESEGALHRLAREAGVPDDGPAEIVGAVLEELRRLRCYEALSPRMIKKERERCLGILDELVDQLQSPIPYHAAKRARSRVASGAAPHRPGTGADDLPNPEPPEPTYPCAKCGRLCTKAQGGTTFTVCDGCWEETHSEAEPEWPTLAICSGHAGGCAVVARSSPGFVDLRSNEAKEVLRRWEAEPKLQAEVERRKGFAAFPLSEEVARLRAKIEQAISVIRAGFPSETRALDEGGKTHGFQWTAFAVYRILTGKES